MPLGEHDPGRLRFINYTYIFASAGRLEIYLNGHWGTICGVGFGSEDAIVACNQLGYRTYRQYGTVGQLGWVITVVVPFVERFIIQCPYFGGSTIGGSTVYLLLSVIRNPSGAPYSWLLTNLNGYDYVGPQGKRDVSLC